MKRFAYLAGALWVVLVITAPEVLAQGRGHGPPPKPPASKLPAPKAPPSKAPPQPMADRTEHPLDRWAAMPPKQREAELAKRPPEKAEELRKRIANWEKMTPDQKERARHFAALPPDQKRVVREHAAWMQQLPDERRPIVRKEINSLQSLSPEARQAELDSPSFSRKFNADEREHIGKLISTMEQ